MHTAVDLQGDTYFVYDTYSNNTKQFSRLECMKNGVIGFQNIEEYLNSKFMLSAMYTAQGGLTSDLDKATKVCIYSEGKLLEWSTSQLKDNWNYLSYNAKESVNNYIMGYCKAVQSIKLQLKRLTLLTKSESIELLDSLIAKYSYNALLQAFDNGNTGLAITTGTNPTYEPADKYISPKGVLEPSLKTTNVEILLLPIVDSVEYDLNNCNSTLTDIYLPDEVLRIPAFMKPDTLTLHRRCIKY